MTAALKAVPAGDLITIQVVSNRERGESRYPAPVGLIDKASMVKLADAVADAGGTRNAFNRTARQTGAPASGGATYTLVGWAGAGEGAGLKPPPASTGPVMCRCSRASSVPATTPSPPGRDHTSTANPQTLQNLQLAKPTGAWPLDADPGAQRAISYLARPTSGSARPAERLLDAGVRRVDDELDHRRPESVPYPSDASFTQDQFEIARAELIKELGWVGNVRTYLKNLSTPFADNALSSWVAAQKIADRVYDDADRPGDEVAFRWVEFTRIILGLLGPVTHEVTAVVGHLLDLGIWMYGADANGASTYREVRTKADDLVPPRRAGPAGAGDLRPDGRRHRQRLREAERGRAQRRLQCVLTQLPAGAGVQLGDRIAASADVYRSVERLAYTKLLPLGYHVFALNPYEGKAPPYPPNYNCNFHPWKDDYTDKAPYARARCCGSWIRRVMTTAGTPSCSRSRPATGARTVRRPRTSCSTGCSARSHCAATRRRGGWASRRRGSYRSQTTITGTAAF